MKKVWQLQEAKNKFSEVVDRAIEEGPQAVTRHGKQAVMILSVKDYEKMVRPADKLVDFFRNSPLHGVELDLKRNKDTSRELEL